MRPPKRDVIYAGGWCNAEAVCWGMSMSKVLTQELILHMKGEGLVQAITPMLGIGAGKQQVQELTSIDGQRESTGLRARRRDEALPKERTE